MAGVLASIAGLLLTCITYSGEANTVLGSTYTLNSIAAVVIGGASLFGGSGGAIGSIFGAFGLRAIQDLRFGFHLPPPRQPPFPGLLLPPHARIGPGRVLPLPNRPQPFRVTP